MLQVRDTVTTGLRKTKGTSGLTAGEVRNKETFVNMLRHDDGYAILLLVSNTPSCKHVSVAIAEILLEPKI